MTGVGFWAHDVPWGGLESVPKERLPTFATQKPAAKQQPQPGPEEAGAREILKGAGLGGVGQVRVCFRDGKDTAEHEPAPTLAHFSGRTADGTSFTTRKLQSGEWALVCVCVCVCVFCVTRWWRGSTTGRG